MFKLRLQENLALHSLIRKILSSFLEYSDPQCSRLHSRRQSSEGRLQIQCLQDRIWTGYPNLGRPGGQRRRKSPVLYGIEAMSAILCLSCTDIILYDVGFAVYEGFVHPKENSFGRNTVQNFLIAGRPSSIIRE